MKKIIFILFLINIGYIIPAEVRRVPGRKVRVSRVTPHDQQQQAAARLPQESPLTVVRDPNYAIFAARLHGFQDKDQLAKHLDELSESARHEFTRGLSLNTLWQIKKDFEPEQKYLQLIEAQRAMSPEELKERSEHPSVKSAEIALRDDISSLRKHLHDLREYLDVINFPEFFKYNSGRLDQAEDLLQRGNMLASENPVREILHEVKGRLNAMEEQETLSIEQMEEYKKLFNKSYVELDALDKKLEALLPKPKKRMEVYQEAEAAPKAQEAYGQKNKLVLEIDILRNPIESRKNEIQKIWQQKYFMPQNKKYYDNLLETLEGKFDKQGKLDTPGQIYQLSSKVNKIEKEAKQGCCVIL